MANFAYQLANFASQLADLDSHAETPASSELCSLQNAVVTWHKFPNPGGAISTKNVIFPIQRAQFWLKNNSNKNVPFPTHGTEFRSNICDNMSYLVFITKGAQF